jgi:hypothetical protein
MSVILVDRLPDLEDSALSLRCSGLSAFVRSPRFIARICLTTGKIEWLIERSPVPLTDSVWHLPRRIRISGSDLWVGEADPLVAEVLPTEDGGVAVSARHAKTGKQIWERFISIPEAADWAETSPAWPGAQTEEIYGFIARDAQRLVICLFRQSRRSMRFAPGIRVVSLPPYQCQTDVIRVEPLTGTVVWRASFQDLFVEILERECFTGIWSDHRRLGMLDFENGTNATLYESRNRLGWPVCDGSVLGVPWHSKTEVGVDWIDKRGSQTRRGAWPQPRVRSTNLHTTESGLALQTNDQKLWWLGKEDLPLWSVRAKPYIYRVHCAPETNVFVGTDGNGGRLLGLDAVTGRETLNLKPALGGVGDVTKVPGHDVLVSSFRISRAYSRLARLLVVSMKDGTYDLAIPCRCLVGTWEHGAICLTGSRGEQFAIVDIRSK